MAEEVLPLLEPNEQEEQNLSIPQRWRNIQYIMTFNGTVERVGRGFDFDFTRQITSQTCDQLNQEVSDFINNVKNDRCKLNAKLITLYTALGGLFTGSLYLPDEYTVLKILGRAALAFAALTLISHLHTVCRMNRSIDSMRGALHDIFQLQQSIALPVNHQQYPNPQIQ